jgi:hypothetical protein
VFRLMRLHPPHGWPAVWWELVIVTMGVLIALGADQLLQNRHWNQQVALFRDAVHAELAEDLGTYQFRNDQNACVQRRLDELENWLSEWRTGHPRTPLRPIGTPRSLSLRTSVWESRDANLVSHMDMQERMTLGRLYDYFENNEVHRLDERQTWLELAEFDGAEELDHRDMMRLRGLISRARLRGDRMTANAALYFRNAAQIGIAPTTGADSPAPTRELCESLFSPPTATSTS